MTKATSEENILPARSVCIIVKKKKTKTFVGSEDILADLYIFKSLFDD